MATHSSVLAWRIPGMVDPGGLPSMGLHRAGHDWSNLAAAAAQLDPQGRDSLCWHQFRNKHYLLHYINDTNNVADDIVPLKVALTAV